MPTYTTKTINVTFTGTNGDITPVLSDYKLGNDGEHLNTLLDILLPTSWGVFIATTPASYLAVEYVNSKGKAGRSANIAIPALITTHVSYSIPRDALYAPETALAFTIYQDIDGISTRVVKSIVVRCSIGEGFTAGSIANPYGNDIVQQLLTILDTKVDKVTGKELSDNNYTDAEVLIVADAVTKAGSQTITGKKSFTTVPSSSESPVDNTDLTNKLYVGINDALKINKNFTAETAETEILDTDIFPMDKLNGTLKKTAWSLIKSTLKTVHDGYYIAKTANVTAIDETGIADGEIVVFDKTAKTLKTSNATIVSVLGADDTTVPTSKAVKDMTDTLVVENVAIVSATKTKITYDAKGLVTFGEDATTADITDSLDKRYVTDADLIVLGNTSGTNTGDQDLSGKVDKVVGSSLVPDTAITDLTDGNETILHKHSANGINIVDTAGYYAGTEVETALAEIGASIITGEINKKYKIVAGVIRNVAGVWSILTDATHSPINISSISQTDDDITINFPFTAKKVGSLVCNPDEIYVAEGLQFGASVGLANAVIRPNINKVVGGYISYNGSSWVITNTYGVTSAVWSTDKLVITHANLYQQAPNIYNAQVTHRDGVHVAQLGSFGANTIEVKFYDFAGTLVTTPNANMKIYFSRTAYGRVRTQDLGISGSNIWIYGIFEV